MICAAFGIRNSRERDERRQSARRARRKRRDEFSCRENAAVSTVRTNDERRASCATKDFAQKERTRRRRRKRETVVDALVSREKKNPTELYCLRKGFSLEVAFAAVGRAGPHVAPSRGAGRAARPRCSRVRASSRRELRARVVSTSSAPRGTDRGRRLVIARLFESASDATRFRARGSRRGDAPSVRTKHARDG